MYKVIQVGILEKKPNSYSISTEGKEKKMKKLLREVIVKIRLKQEDNEKEIMKKELL